MCAHAGRIVSVVSNLYACSLGTDIVWALIQPMCLCNFQGTTRPAHYQVLHDEIGFSPDALQELVHALSYVYAHWHCMYSAEKKNTAFLFPMMWSDLQFANAVNISRYQRSTLAISVGMRKLLACTCTSAISVGINCFTDQRQCFARAVAPVYYAHLAAAQVRQFVTFDDASETASSASGGQAPPVPELPRLHENVRSSMFFCWVKQRSGVGQRLMIRSACWTGTHAFSFRSKQPNLLWMCFCLWT